MANIKGTNVAAPVVPFDTTDVHPSHEALYGKGGYRTVASNADRDAIPSARREAGMLVHVTATGLLWQLGGDLTTWSTFAAGAPTSLSQLADVQISSPATGDVLRYNGTSWSDYADVQLTDGGNF